MKKQNLVKISIYGSLGTKLKHRIWNLAVKSVGEAIHAIEILSQRKLYKLLYENDKKGIHYILLINGEKFVPTKEMDSNRIETIRNSELCIKRNDLQTIDIIPVLQGGDIEDPYGWLIGSTIEGIAPGTGIGAAGFFIPNEYRTIILGVMLIIAGIVVGIFAGWTGVGGIAAAALVAGGLGLLAAGIYNLLIQPPKEPEISARQKTSYLFDGPANTISEGGPVPVGYGKLLIGGVVISASYDIEQYNAES